MTQLRVVDPPRDAKGRPDPWSAKPGDMWPCASDAHKVDGRAPCWVVRLPERAWVWHTNMAPTDGGGGFWTVTGEPPNITVHPSINVGPEIWHGWITDGALSPDEAST